MSLDFLQQEDLVQASHTIRDMEMENKFYIVNANLTWDVKIENIQIANYADIDKPIEINHNYIDTLYKVIQLPHRREEYISTNFFDVMCSREKDGYRMCQCDGTNYNGLPTIEFTLRETKYQLKPKDYTLMPKIDKRNF